MSIFISNQATPVIVYREAGRFKSAAQAARKLGIAKTSVRMAAMNGIQAGGCYIRYADMPIECQPLPRRVGAIPVVWQGKKYPSIMAAARATGWSWTAVWRAMKSRGHSPVPKRKRRLAESVLGVAKAHARQAHGTPAGETNYATEGKPV